MTTAVPSSFDVLTQPWIPVVWMEHEPADSSDRVGLVQVVLDAHRIRRIIGDTPPMTAALHRLVLALLHRAYDPRTAGEWGELWNRDTLPSEPLAAYVEPLRDRFDLFGQDRPFLQCPALSRVTPSTVAKLVPHRAVGNNVTLFDHTVVGGSIELTPDEAARWLVTAHAYDPGGMKTPYTRDKSSERGLCNLFGVVLVEGATLKETLLLNALVHDPGHEQPRTTFDGDMPAWERAEPPSGEPDSSPANGWTNLLTWSSRRILLSHTVRGGRTLVDGVVVTPGVRFTGSLDRDERMAAFRRPRAAQGKPQKAASLLPVRLHPLRGVWRHSVELLLTDTREKDRSRLRPQALNQIETLVEGRHLPHDAVFTLRVFGQQLDKNAAVLEAYLEDEVPAPVPILRSRNRTLGALIGTAIALADDVGVALRRMERDYRKDRRADPTSDLDLAYWPRLARHFGRVLRELGDAADPVAPQVGTTDEWARAVERAAREAAERWAEGVPADTGDLLVIAKHYDRFLDDLDRLIRVFTVDDPAIHRTEGDRVTRTLRERRGKFTNYLYDLHRQATSNDVRRAGEARQALARLRRAFPGPCYEAEAHEYVFPHDPPVSEQETWLLIAGLFALHPQPRRPAHRRSLGGSMGELEVLRGGAASRRFTQLLARDRDSLPHHLRQAIRSLMCHGIGVDFDQLLDDLVVLLGDRYRGSEAHSVRLRWARDFHRPHKRAGGRDTPGESEFDDEQLNPENP